MKKSMEKKLENWKKESEATDYAGEIPDLNLGANTTGEQIHEFITALPIKSKYFNFFEEAMMNPATPRKTLEHLAGCGWGELERCAKAKLDGDEEEYCLAIESIYDGEEVPPADTVYDVYRYLIDDMGQEEGENTMKLAQKCHKSRFLELEDYDD